MKIRHTVKIKELRITSFGKFQNKIIKFDDGFNVVYGLNEAGKSTVHKFIEGMIFGFFLPRRTRRYLSDSHRSYEPRASNSYTGSMIIEYQGRELNIHRNFASARPSLQILDNVTGEDISATLPVNAATRLPDLAAYLGIDYTLYNDTISVSQMQSETSANLADVVVEKLTNLAASRTETISVPDVVDRIDNELKSIGTRQARTQPYAKTVAKLASLNAELQVANEKYKEISDHQAAIKALAENKTRITQKLKTLDKQKDVYKNELLKQKYQTVKKLDDEKEALAKQASKLAKFKKVSEESYQRALILNNDKTTATKALSTKQTEKTTLEQKQRKLTTALNLYPYLKAKEITLVDFNKDYADYNLLTSKINSYHKEIKAITGAKVATVELKELSSDYEQYVKINATNYEDALRDLNYEQRLADDRLERLEAKLPNPVLKYVFIALIPLIIGIFLLLNFNAQTKKIQEKIKLHTAAIKQLQAQQNDLETKLNAQKTFNEQMYAKYKVLTDERFKMLYIQSGVSPRADHEERLNELNALIATDTQALEALQTKITTLLTNVTNKAEINDENIKDLQQVIVTNNETKTNLARTNEKLSEINRELATSTETIKNLRDQLATIFKTNNVKSLDEFKTALANKQRYLEEERKISALAQRMEDYLEGISLEELHGSIDFTAEETFDKETYESLLNEENNLREQAAEITKEETQRSEAIKHLEDTHREPGLIEADILTTQQKLNEYDTQIAALNLIKTTLDEVSETIQYEFAPVLNERISSVMKDITNDKYNEIRIDRAMNVRVFESSTQQNVDIKGFSMGTIDQIYLAMRLGINQTVSEHIHPLIFDDTFVNYDVDRLKETLRILHTETQQTNRQIILFTCHKREQTVLKDLGIKFKLVNL